MPAVYLDHHSGGFCTQDKKHLVVRILAKLVHILEATLGGCDCWWHSDVGTCGIVPIGIT